MKVYSDINSLPAFVNPVVTIGTFDGVHLGHRKIIDQLIQEAKKINGETVIITFHPHPRKIVSSNRPVLHLINTPGEKIKLLSSLQIDHLVIIPFTEAFAAQTASAYVEEFLISRFHPHTLIIGYDHRFGKGRSGDFKLLEKYAAKQQFHLIEIPQHLLHESAISSTRIRENLLNGNIKEANELLGYPYFLTGTVIPGNKIGRSIGYPTANLEVNDDEKLIPANGVYAVNAMVKDIPDNEPGPGSTSPVEAKTGERIKGMMNIGIRPTINGNSRVIEVNLFDFNEDIYGKLLEVHITRYLRNEQKFNGLEALKEQLAIDKIHARQALC